MLLQKILVRRTIHRAVSEETSEFSFQGQLVLHPTAHQSVIPLDSFRKHPAGDSLPSRRCLQWTGRERRQAGSLGSRGMADLSESCGRRRHVTACGNLSSLKKKRTVTATAPDCSQSGVNPMLSVCLPTFKFASLAQCLDSRT